MFHLSKNTPGGKGASIHQKYCKANEKPTAIWDKGYKWGQRYITESLEGKTGRHFFLNEGIQNHPLFENLESHIHVRAKHKPRKCLAKLLALATFSHKQKMKAKAVLCNLNVEEVPWHMINQQRLEGFVCFPFSSFYYFLLSFLIFFFFFRGSWYPKHP